MKLAGLLLLLLSLAARSFAQAPPNDFNSGCDEKHKTAILQPDDPAYPYAIDLAKTLTAKGVHIQCLCASKMQRFFPGQRSAAWFQTSEGIFEALFLPTGQDFHVELVDNLQRGRHLYSFRGSPATAVTMDTPQVLNLIQHRNVLLVLVENQPLATHLDRALNSE